MAAQEMPVKEQQQHLGKLDGKLNMLTKAVSSAVISH